MKPAVVIVSVGLHGLVLGLLPTGHAAPRPEPPASDGAPIEVFIVGPSPSVETAPPAETPPAAPLPADPTPADSAPAPQAPPAPTPAAAASTTPRPQSAATRRRPRAPRAAPPEAASPPSTPGGSSPRRLPMTMSNGRQDGRAAEPRSGERTGRPSPGGAGPASAQPESRCAGARVKAVATHKVPIVYPPAARADGLEGQLVLRADVDARGRVTHVQVVRSVGAAIDEPAKAALAGWRFKAATRCGEPVDSRFTIARTFELGD